MIIQKRFKNLISASEINILALLDKVGVSNSSYYRYINGISDIYAESFVKILKELGIDIENIISQKANELLGNKNSEISLGDDFEQVFQQLSRTNKMTLLDTIISDAQKTKKPSLQGPIGRLKECKSKYKGRGTNASGGKRR